MSPLLKFGKRKVFTVRKLVSCDVDKVRGITIFVRKKVGGIDPTHPQGFGAYVSAAVGHRRAEPGRKVFLLKTDTNPYPTLSDPRGGVLTPTDPRTAENKGGYDLCPGGFGRTPPETIARTTEQNLIEFYALVNLKPQ